MGADTLEIAGYEILHRLGGGGMGEVFLVRHPRLPRNDALKLLTPALSVNSEFCQRFEREADLLAPLRHPNIITLYDRGNYDGRLWLTMEHIPGSDASELTKAGALDVAAVIDIIACVGDALDYAYSEHAVTHRDIKPANILVETGQHQCIKTVKLVDFGIAKAAGETTSLTATGIAIGTANYIAPEALEGTVTDNRADIYSLACTAFQMLTRALPYPQRSIPALIAAHLTEPTPAITRFGTHLPEYFNDVFTRALAKNPDERFSSCREFTDALGRPNSPRLGAHTRAWIKSVAVSGNTSAAAANAATTQAAPTINAIRARKPPASKARPAAALNPRLIRARRLATLSVTALSALGILLIGGIGLIANVQNRESNSSVATFTSEPTTTTTIAIAPEPERSPRDGVLPIAGNVSHISFDALTVHVIASAAAADCGTPMEPPWPDIELGPNGVALWAGGVCMPVEDVLRVAKACGDVIDRIDWARKGDAKCVLYRAAQWDEGDYQLSAWECGKPGSVGQVASPTCIRRRPT